MARARKPKAAPLDALALVFGDTPEHEPITITPHNLRLVLEHMISAQHRRWERNLEERRDIERRQNAPKALVAEMRNNLRSRFAEAFAGADATFDGDKIREQVIAELIKERREIILRLLGMTDRWGKLELDGSNGGGIFKKLIEEHATAAIHTFVKDMFQGFFEAEVTKLGGDTKFRNELIKGFAQHMRWKVEQQVNKHGDEAALTLARQLADEFKKELTLVAEE